MTTKEFDTNTYRAGDQAIYHGEKYDIASIDFEERLFGILMNISGGHPTDISWVRCENCELVKK